MSIPSYQFASLQMENDAKKRVMKRAKKGFETEEQRAIKSGRVVDSIKNVYNTITANLEMQKSTIEIALQYIKSMAYSVIIDEPPRGFADDEGMEGTVASNKEDAVVGAERSLGSFIFASLGKLVKLSFEFVGLVNALGDEVLATGKPATPSIGINKIISLMADVDRLYGNWGVDGLAKAISVLEVGLREKGQYPPQLDGLLDLWEENNREAGFILQRIQTNQYTATLKSVHIPSKTKDPVRRGDIARGEERRDFTGKEYKLMMQLRSKGLLSGDDFTSVYSGEDDDATISTYGTFSSASSSDDDDDDDADARRQARRDADRNVFGRVPDSDDESSVRSAETVYLPRNYWDDSSVSSSGSGLYTLPFGRSGVPMRLL